MDFGLFCCSETVKELKDALHSAPSLSLKWVLCQRGSRAHTSALPWAAVHKTWKGKSIWKMHRAVDYNALDTLLLLRRQKDWEGERYMEWVREREKDRERVRETCPGLISSSTRMGLMAGLDERLCKHLLTVHHLPIALQRLIVHSQSHLLLFHWPAQNQTQVWNRGNRKKGGTW